MLPQVWCRGGLLAAERQERRGHHHLEAAAHASIILLPLSHQHPNIPLRVNFNIGSSLQDDGTGSGADRPVYSGKESWYWSIWKGAIQPRHGRILDIRIPLAAGPCLRAILTLDLKFVCQFSPC